MSEYILKNRSGYTSVPNAAMADTRLKIEDRGLLAMLMTHKSGWKFNRQNILKKCGCGRKKYDAMVRRLKEFGYLKINRKRLKNGQFGDYEWEVFYAPEPVSQNATCGEKPTVALTDVGKGNHLSVTNSKVIKEIPKGIPKKSGLFENVQNEWNSFGEPFKPIRLLSETRKQNIARRAKQFGEASIFEVLSKARASPYFREKWTPGFDWLWQPKNFLKIIEGNYDKRNNQPSSSAEAQRQGVAAAFDMLRASGYE